MTKQPSIKTLVDSKLAERIEPKNKTDALWPLDEWAQSIYEVPFTDYSDRDIGIAIRQRVFLDHVVPVALDRIAADPDAGFAYDGELSESLAGIAKDFWARWPELALLAKRCICSRSGITSPALQSFTSMLSEFT